MAGQLLIAIPGETPRPHWPANSSLVASGEPLGGPRFHAGYIDAYVRTIG